MNKVFPDPALKDVEKLLAANGLPTGDLYELDNAMFFSCREENCLTGVVGLEIHGVYGLLRSLAVHSKYQRRGYANVLLDAVETYARFANISELYLLTDTAAAFFERHDYTVILRECAPSSIRATHQFSQLCPASAALMQKSL